MASTLVVVTTFTLPRRFAAPEATPGLAIRALALPRQLVDGHELVDKIGWTWLPGATGVRLRAGIALGTERRFGILAHRCRRSRADEPATFDLRIHSPHPRSAACPSCIPTTCPAP